MRENQPSPTPLSLNLHLSFCLNFISLDSDCGTVISDSNWPSVGGSYFPQKECPE